MMSVSAAYAQCDTELKAQDYDRWLACLFLPEPARKHAHAVYAFSLEIARVRESVREALAGEIRLQYWRDVLTNGVSDNPVAMAFLDTMQTFALPVLPLQNLIDARIADLYDDGFITQNDLEGYCGETCSILFQFVALVLTGGASAPIDTKLLSEAAGHAGVAYAMAGLLSVMPVHIARGQCYIPEETLKKHDLTRNTLGQPEALPKLKALLNDMRELALSHLQKSQLAVAQLPKSVAPAFLPLAFVRINLNAVAKNADPVRQLSVGAPWRKIVALWWKSTRT